MANISNIQIYILHNKFENMEEYIREIEYGIEEEGIPWIAKESDIDGHRELSIEAANSSKLNVGIGIDSSGNACIRHKNFREDQFLFEQNIFDDGTDLRDIGINSARLIKGIPFNL